jgi:hypothetical protein
MVVEIITKDDLQHFKKELVAEIKQVLVSKHESTQYLQSKQVRAMLGISPGTLQQLRISRQLPFTKIGGKVFYELRDIQQMIEQNKDSFQKR